MENDRHPGRSWLKSSEGSSRLGRVRHLIIAMLIATSPLIPSYDTAHALVVGNVVWSRPQALNLTYCIDRRFGPDYQAVVNAMEEATAAWEAAANVNFIHQRSYGPGSRRCTRSSPVVFNVRSVTGQPFIVRSFFPVNSRQSREVLIDDTALGDLTPFTLAGLLRHALGHTLGFRHEHARLSSGPCPESPDFFPVTPYDAASVMHYPHCQGTNAGDYTLTDLDRQGAALVYGVPSASR